MGTHKITDQQGLYFLTLTVVGWIDVFTREKYIKIIIDSLKFCKQYKGLKLYAYVVMSNHIHLIVSSNLDNDLSDTIRDFKSYSAKSILRAIENSKQESRRKWMLYILSHLANEKGNAKYQFWKIGNRPIKLTSPKFINQKIDYIHLNPVRAGIVCKPEEYKYSSAKNYLEFENVMDVDLIILMSNVGFVDVG